MAHIPNSNILNPIAVNHSVSAPIATVSSLIKATASIDNELMMALRDPATQRPLDIPQSKVSLSQAKLLQSQNVLIQTNAQLTQVFLANALKPVNVSLSPSLVPLLEQYLKRKQVDNTAPLPKELLILLAKSLKSSEIKLNQKIVQVSAKTNSMFALILVDEPIVKIGSETKSGTTLNQDSLMHLLSLVIPIDDIEQSFVAINQHNSNASTKQNGDNILFEFTMDLTPLGVVCCAISLNGFNLNIEANCSNQQVKTKVNQHWNLFEERLTKLGFSTNCQFSIDQGSMVNKPSSRLIDIKI